MRTGPLRSPRPYKPGSTHEQTREIMLSGDQRMDPKAHFDPSLLELFVRRRDGVAEIYDRLAG